MKTRELLKEPAEKSTGIVELLIAKYGILTILLLVGVFLFVAKTYDPAVLTEVSLVIMGVIASLKGWINAILKVKD